MWKFPNLLNQPVLDRIENGCVSNTFGRKNNNEVSGTPCAFIIVISEALFRVRRLSDIDSRTRI